MSTSYTTNARLQKPASADLTWDVPLNQNTDWLDGVSAIGGLVVVTKETPSTTLNVKVAAGTYVKADGSFGSYAGTASQAMTGSATNYVYLTDGGTLTVSTSSFPATAHVRLAVVVAGGSTITSVTDARVPCATAGTTVYLARAGGTMDDSGGVVTVNMGTTNGTKIGGSTSNKIGFYNATPVVQPSGANQAAAAAQTQQTLTDSTGGSASTTLASATNTASLTDSSGGSATTTLNAISDTATKDAVASLAAQLATQRTLNTVLINGLASLAARLAEVKTDVAAVRTLANQLRSDLVTLGVIKGSA